MLQKKFRLPSSAISKNKTVLTYPSLRILFWENTLPHNRFAITVSKKVDRRAVTRNRYRRILLAAIHEHFLNLPQGLDVLLQVRNIGTETEGVFRSDFSQFLHEVKRRFA